MRKTPLVMVVLDGWGIGTEDTSNPVYVSKPKAIDHIRHTYPAGALQAAGVAVGLPWGETGDSEVGHLTLGAGKVLYQHYPRITLAIKDGSFFKSEPILSALAHSQKNNSQLHIIGLIGKNNIHSSFEHLENLLKLVRDKNVKNAVLHLFTDGRDSPAKEAANLITNLPRDLIASVSGRFFAMDKDVHWDRTVRVYNMLTGSEDSVAAKKDIPQLLNDFYARGLTDEFIEPTLINPERRIRDGDSIVFFNFREDSMRQITEMFTNPRAGGEHAIPQTSISRHSQDTAVNSTYRWLFPRTPSQILWEKFYPIAEKFSCALPKRKNTLTSLTSSTASRSYHLKTSTGC
jgi:2,3-bisphosphoglycerate-independent phosphoglycerate mutase